MYCPKCDNYVPEWSDKCLACGCEVRAEDKKENKQRSSEYAYETGREKQKKVDQQEEYYYATYETPEKQFNKSNKEKDKTTHRFSTHREKIFAIMCYFGPLFIVSLLAEKDSSYIKFHANQGLLLFIVGIIADILSGFTLIYVICNLVVLYLMVCGIKNASRGIMKGLPWIGDIQIFKY